MYTNELVTNIAGTLPKQERGMKRARKWKSTWTTMLTAILGLEYSVEG
jgi:hypothetical protein